MASRALSRHGRTEVSPRRKFTGPPSRHRGPWYAVTVTRLNFERGVKRQFPSVLGTKLREGYEYRATVSVPHYEARNVHIRFSGMSKVPSVFAEGPRESPHRYPNNSLCMWYPEDPVDRRWVFEDGLLALIGLVMAHLFREAWWRETGEWPGQEVPHGREAKKGSNE